MKTEFDTYLSWRSCRRCSKCKEIKPFLAFGINKANKNGLSSQCKDCRNYRVVSKRYSLGSEGLKRMFQAQQGKCAICKHSEVNLKKGLAVDHCHKTGKVRGLLCGNCNNGLGRFKDKIEYLKQAISYLERTV